MIACRRFAGMLIASLVLTLVCAANVFAIPVTWTLSGVTFDDGGTLSGYFVYDADTNDFSLGTLTAAGGNTGVFGSITYQGPWTILVAGHPENGFYSWAPGFGQYLNIVPTGLTDAGGTVALSTQSWECTNCGSIRYVSAGNVVGTPTPYFTSADSTTFAVGTAGSFMVTSAAATSVSVAGSLPSGVTFTDNGDGTATLAGTPASGSGGSYSLLLTASNGVIPDATQAFTLTVNAPVQTVPTPTLTWPGVIVLLVLLLAGVFYSGRRTRITR